LDRDRQFDSAGPQALWPDLATLYGALGQQVDAALCWMSALWETDVPPLRWLSLWSASEGKLADAGAVDRALGELLQQVSPSPADLRALVAWLVWAAHHGTPRPDPMWFVQSKDFLTKHEHLLPVRAAWLAWVSLAELGYVDARSLAPARDRLLRRLARSGLKPEVDLPNFLRFTKQMARVPVRGGFAIGDWLIGLAERAQEWIKRPGNEFIPSEEGRRYPGQTLLPKTNAYVDLIFAFGLARLGEVDACNRLRQRAHAELDAADEAHSFLAEAYDYRIQQALDGKPHGGPLSPEQMARLPEIFEGRAKRGEWAGVGAWYIIDRMRGLSRILEPDQEIKADRHLLPALNELERNLRELPDVLDRAKVAERVRALLAKVPKKDGAELRARILRAGLEQALRVGEDFALELLAQLPPTFDALPPPSDDIDFDDHARLLEKGLFVAAHFDRAEYVQKFVARFGRLLRSLPDAPMAQALDSLAGQSFRGLRKMGMQQEIGQLLHLMAEVLLKGGDLRTVEDPKWRARQPAALRALLHVAAGWYYLGKDAEAETVLKAARATLLAPPRNPNDGAVERNVREVLVLTRLTCAYATALSHAPVEIAQKRFEELFEKLERIRDNFTTSAHYCQVQIRVIEAVILAVTSDDFAGGRLASRWLDEEEALVRRRIHHDFNTLCPRDRR
jgi:hypothetical protein